jgi:hypothetical protein
MAFPDEEEDDDAVGYPPSAMTDSGYVDTLADVGDVGALRDILSGYSGAWVSFRRDFDLSFKGDYGNHLTPEGIYGLPVDRVVAWADEYRGLNRSARMKSDFHTAGFTRRPVGVVFKPSGPVVCTEDFFGVQEAFERLLAYVKDRRPKAVQAVEQWRPKNRGDRNLDRYLDSRSVFWMTEAATDAVVGSVEWRGFRHHPDKPQVWREMMLAAGASAFEDRACFMTGDLLEQIAVFDENALEMLHAFENPASAAAPEPSFVVAPPPGRVPGR